MLIIEAVVDQPEHGIKKGDRFRLYIVDAHHHMGREGTHRNTPIGAYDFYTLLWFELKKMSQHLLENEELLFEPVSIKPPKLPTKLFSSRKSWRKMNHGWMVDRTIVFPYSDDYAKSKIDEVAFKVSNDKIAGWTTRAPHSSRLIGFLRLDPSDGKTFGLDILEDEIDRCVDYLGLRGIKLHPISQLFIDDIASPSMRTIFHKAGTHSLPIIIDTRNIRTVLKLKSLIDTMDSVKDMVVPKIILAHAGMSPSDTRLYESLCNPNIYCETSSIHGLDVPLLFDMAQKNIGSNWSEKILFGTDYSFLSTQANEVILHLLSRNFNGTLSDIQSILGGNAMKLVQTPYRRKSASEISSLRITCTRSPSKTRHLLENEIVKSIGNGDLDLQSIDLMVPGGEKWPQLQPLFSGGFNGIHFRSYLLSLKSTNDILLHLWIRESPRQFLSCAILSLDEIELMSEGAFSPQRLNSILIDSILDTSEIVESPQILVRRIQEHILKSTPNKS